MLTGYRLLGLGGPRGTQVDEAEQDADGVRALVYLCTAQAVGKPGTARGVTIALGVGPDLLDDPCVVT